MRQIQFQTGEYYHIYNRGVDKREIFCDQYDYVRFLVSMKEFNTLHSIGSLYEKNYAEKQLGSQLATELLTDNTIKLVDIICYSLIPNHHHFILKQLVESGVSKYMHKLNLGYTQYFNQKYKRSGSLFEGKFKAIHINSSDYLIWLSAYINGNPEIHKIEKAENWPWSSCMDYLDLRKGILPNKKEVLNYFQNVKEYKNFLKMAIEDCKERKDEAKLQLLEGL